MIDIAFEIYQARHSAKMTQVDLAVCVNTYANEISEYETGKHMPSAKRFFDIMEACGVKWEKVDVQAK